MPVTIFFCYAREDEALLKKLKTHLLPLQRQGIIDIWYDDNIGVGPEWEQEIRKHLNTAQIILLLISPDFMSSDYCNSEMELAVARHERGEARVIPVILDYVHWQVPPIHKLTALPTGERPVMSGHWHNVNEALFNVTEGIRMVIRSLADPSSLSAVDEAILQTQIIPPTIQRGRNTPSFISLITVEKPKLHCTLTGHTGTIVSITLSPNGQTIVSGSDDATIKVWDLSSGHILRTLSGHTDRIETVAMSPDGQIIVSGSRDTTINVWNLSSGQVLHTLTGQTGHVLSVAISSDGQNLASSSQEIIRVWNLPTGQLLHTLTGHTHIVGSVAISPDGQTLVSGSHDHTIKIWDLSTGQVLRTLFGHEFGVWAVLFNANGKTLMSAGQDTTIMEWNLSTGQLLRILSGHTNSVRSIALSADGQILVSGSNDHTIKVWSLSTGQELYTLPDPGIVMSVAISPDGKTIVSAGTDKAIKVWKM